MCVEGGEAEISISCLNGKFFLVEGETVFVPALF